jgi:hypothetical protein
MSELAVSNPMHMVEAAVEKGADVDVLEKLLGLQERFQRGQAERAFVEALSAVRGELPAIVKTKSANFGGGGAAYKYEDLSDIIAKLSPVLAKHGLSFRWNTDGQTADRGEVLVTCVLSHRDGHSESTSLSGPYDTSGKKNAIQAIGSVVTYLQRYTLKAAIGIAAGMDDDGQGADGARQSKPQPPATPNSPTHRPATERQRDRFRELCEEAHNLGVIGSQELDGALEWISSEKAGSTVGAQIRELSAKIDQREDLERQQEGGDTHPPVDDPGQEQMDLGDVSGGEDEGDEEDGATILNALCEKLKVADADGPVGATFVPRLKAAMSDLGIGEQYPLVKLRGLANEFDAARFPLGMGPFDYDQIPGHIGMMIIEYIAEKGEVHIDV